VIHERLVADYGFTGHYQRVKLYAAEARERVATELGERAPLTATRLAIHATGPDPVLLARHSRAERRGEDHIDPAHWDGLPDGHTRATTRDDATPTPATTAHPAATAADTGLAVLPARSRLATPVARRDLADYDAASAVILPFRTPPEDPVTEVPPGP
jgi:hypothetical protein